MPDRCATLTPSRLTGVRPAFPNISFFMSYILQYFGQNVYILRILLDWQSLSVYIEKCEKGVHESGNHLLYTSMKTAASERSAPKIETIVRDLSQLRYLQWS